MVKSESATDRTVGMVGQIVRVQRGEVETQTRRCAVSLYGWMGAYHLAFSAGSACSSI